MASIRKYSASLEGKSKERYQQKLALIDGVDPYTIRKKDWSEKVDDYPSISYPDIVNYLIGNSGRKKSLAQMKEREKCKKNESSLTSMRQMVLEISHFKVRNLSNMDVAILWILASF